MELSRHLNKADALNAVGSIVSTAQDMFFEQAWKFRCREFNTFERSEGIDQKSKRSLASLSRTNPQNTVSPSTHLYSYPNRWLSWISRALTQGGSWMGFRIHINSLIF